MSKETDRPVTLERIEAKLERILAIIENRPQLARQTDELQFSGYSHPSESGSITARGLQAEFLQPVAFDSLDKLVEAIEGLYDCRDGLYGPYARSGERLDGLRYRVLGFITSGPNAEQRLRIALWHDLIALSSGPGNPKRTLYWRFAKARRIDEESGNATAGETTFKIYTRVAIPDADWSKAKGLHEECGEFTRI